MKYFCKEDNSTKGLEHYSADIQKIKREHNADRNSKQSQKFFYINIAIAIVTLIVSVIALILQ